jgi:hypothetical protein
MMIPGLLPLALVAAQSVASPDVTLQFSSDTVLLGEPVWVVVTAHNRTAFPQRWSPGYYCSDYVDLPVTAVVPDATPGPARPKPCPTGGGGGSCQTVFTPMDMLAAGDSATWRFLLIGDFHFTRAGTYVVQLSSDPGKPGPLGRDGRLDRGRTLPAAPPSALAVTQTRTLVILPRNDAELLARETQWAAEVESAESRRFASRPGGGTGAAAREARQRESDNVLWFRRGLAEHPVPGMEHVFERWLQMSNVYEDDAIRGLKNLDTPASRAVLAQFARTPSRPSSSTQRLSIAALADLTDRRYYPLMLEALASPAEDVRRQAVLHGLGNLGGENGVAKLLELARTSSEAIMVNDALSALGRTGSRTAVKGLIDLIATTGGGRGLLDAGGFPLFLLTHHRLPNVPTLRTADELHQEWLNWWDTTGKNARVYTRFECAVSGNSGSRLERQH